MTEPLPDMWNDAMMRYQLTIRVGEGVDLLKAYFKDSKLSELIDADTVDVASLERCPLGQAFGHYDEGLHALDIPWDKAYAYGFSLTAEDTPNDSQAAWQALNSIWAKEVRKADYA